MNILKRIEQSYNSLAVKEREIAMYVINYPQDVQSMTITELATHTHTSNGSITRFCKKMKCKNFYDLKIQLASTKSSSENEDNVVNNENTILREINKFYKEAINQNIQSIDEDAILTVSNQIIQSEKIYIFGIGSSGLTARELAHRLNRMGITAFTCTDSDSMTISATLMTSKDLVIAISNSGNSRDIIDAVKAAKKNKARVVAFTSFSKSPLTKYSDIYILVYNSLFFNNENFINTQFSLMYLVDILSMFLLNNKLLSNNMNRTVKAIHNK